MDHSIPASPWRSSRLPRALALLTAGALAASGTALGATSASAASGDVNVVDASFTWGLNNYSSFSLDAATGNVVAAPGTSVRAFSATKGQGQLNAAGDGVIDFTGTASYTYATPGPTFPGAFTLSDFELTVAGGTTGTLSAKVGGDATFVVDPAAATRATIATFALSTDATTPGTVTITTADPDYPTSTTYPGGSWPTAFIDLFTSSAKPFWYASGSNLTSASNLSKKPLAFTTTATTATPTTEVSASYPVAGGLDLAVTGTGFAKLNSGVYVGVGPVGLDLAQTSDSAYAANFFDAAWVSTSAIGAGGTLSASLHVPTASLTSTGSYAIYTWNAHTHATTASDSISPVAFSYASLADAVVVPVETSAPTPSPAAKSASTTVLAAVTSKFGAAARLVATVPPAATGTVTFTSDGATLGSAPVASGSASLATSATTRVGSHAVIATYSGDGAFDGSAASSTLTVSKATLSVAVSGSKFAKATKPKLKVTVGALANGTKVAGKVAVYVGSTKVRTVAVTAKNRVVSLTLPKKYSKAITVKAKWLGGATTVAKTSKTITLKIKK